jgi:hypothetical protein
MASVLLRSIAGATVGDECLDELPASCGFIATAPMLRASCCGKLETERDAAEGLRQRGFKIPNGANLRGAFVGPEPFNGSSNNRRSRFV